MPSYKLYYFPLQGRGEVSRLILKQAGVEFEDIRVPFENWMKFKPTTPYGSMPVLEIDAKKLAGSRSIQRYLAEEFGLAGSNAFENAELDSIIDLLNDVGQPLKALQYEKDETMRAEKIEKLKSETLPKFFGIFQKLIANNPSGWLYGSKVTYADLALFNTMDWIKKGPCGESLNAFPAAQKNMEAVAALPNISKWLKERPESAF